MTVDTAQHAIRDGDYRVIYITANRAVYKYFPDTNELVTLLSFAPGEQGHQAGYAGLNRPRLQAELLLLTTGVTPGGPYHYTAAAGWVAKNTGLPAGWHWLRSAVSPNDPNKWLIQGNSTADHPTKYDIVGGSIKAKGTAASPLWYSTDAGATWSQVALQHPFLTSYTAGTFSMADIGGVAWIDDTHWIVLGSSDDLVAPGNTTYFWRGTNGTATLAGPHTVGYAFGALATGLSGEPVIVTLYPNTELYLRYVPSGGSAWVKPGGALLNQQALGIDAALGPARSIAIGMLDGSVLATADYRALQPTLRLPAGSGTFVAAGTDAWYLGGRANGTGMLKVTDLLGTPQTTILPGSEGSDRTVGAIHSDRQTRTRIAARLIGRPDVLISDGQTCQVLAGPAGLTGDQLVNTIESIGRLG